MRFAKHLRDISDTFRKEHLDSTDEGDKTIVEEDWRSMKVKNSVYFSFHIVQCVRQSLPLSSTSVGVDQNL